MSSKEALKDIFDILVNFECLSDIHDNQDIKKQKFDVVEKDLDRLEEYRKIEEEISVDFITLFKILKQRFVYDNDQVKIELLGLHIKSDELYLYGFVEDTMQAVYLRLKDYGKTWALDKEEFYKNIK